MGDERTSKACGLAESAQHHEVGVVQHPGQAGGARAEVHICLIQHHQYWQRQNPQQILLCKKGSGRTISRKPCVERTHCHMAHICSGLLACDRQLAMCEVAAPAL